MSARCCYLDLDGTLFGAGGSIVHSGTRQPTIAGVEALTLLNRAGVPYVLVSGRSQQRLEVVGQVLGAAGVLAELGALDAGFPTAPGQTILDAITATGIIDALLDRDTGLEIHPEAMSGRMGSHCLRGVARIDTAEWVSAFSAGNLRFADNGHIGPGHAHVYHVLPAAATKALSVTRHMAANGFTPESCLAVGDSGEDLEMQSCVGAFALVRNGADADPLVAARAQWITQGTHGDGVLEAVTTWLNA
jgi:hydroxymethylpyrimidine pyrophosphatase-like HAD family hydrolase